ncbi:hypothetical protein IWQ62_001043 [Dispira parvispora]|uniref:Flavodoxin-like domain-containing protein n=1 Tax=Dispira parvispora TaxID=1520584 RepID=A0A9W8AYT3_9FUNG|nr:hypothetical protein IWQ62_001043 [Dispira parvispora]
MSLNTYRPKIYIVFYSMYGHIYSLAKSIKEGCEKVAGVEVHLFQIQETLSEKVLSAMCAPDKPAIPTITPSDLTSADGFLFGVPTRYGHMPEQWKTFLDSTGALWAKGSLSGKFAGGFFSTASQHGGQETTVMNLFTFFAHHGIAFVPLGYRSSFQFDTSQVVGGSAYGAGTITNGDGSRAPSREEHEIAVAQGYFFARVIRQYYGVQTTVEG